MIDPREAELLSKIEEQDERIASMLEEKARWLKERQILQERIDQLLRKIYGGKSERADMYQLQLLMQEMNAPGPALGKESDPEASATSQQIKNAPQGVRESRSGVVDRSLGWCK